MGFWHGHRAVQSAAQTFVAGSGNGYLKTGCDYAHWNPVRAKLIIPEQSLLACRWSSYPEYVKRPGQRTAWLRVDRLFDERGIPFRAE
jgi:hypothetical protein